MAYLKVQEYLTSIGLQDRFRIHSEPTDTVENAARTVGCEPAQIAKTMSFLVNDLVILIVMAGDAKVKNGKFKSKFGIKPFMVPFDQVESLVGHEPGGVCPFALNENVIVYLDVSLKRFQEVHAAGGSVDSTVRMSPQELANHSHSQGWIDVCKDWYDAEDDY
ncbi:MAG: YbaK/EbsC family protein [Candidatus Izemoplasmatales bacterium]|nr:YbaK/EbsC family protein [Candidatus Izemoplasmatales bacterium]